MGNTQANGFGKKTTAEEVIRDADLNGKTVVITGANSGIGLETARVLALHKATVVMCCRSMDKGEKAVQGILAKDAEAKLSLQQLDLASLASVRKAAEELNEKLGQIDVLINNAGIMATPYGTTKDGIEQQLGTNHIGHFLFTNLLLDKVRAAGPGARIVNLSSSAHNMCGVHFDDISGKGTWAQSFMGKWKAYGQSKTANILFSVELAKRLKDEGITVNACHPGVIATNLTQYMSAPERAFASLASVFYKTTGQGAATTVYLATAPEVAEITGKYFADCNLLEAKAYAMDEENAKKLWEVSEQIIADADARNAAKENEPAAEAAEENDTDKVAEGDKDDKEEEQVEAALNDVGDAEEDSSVTVEQEPNGADEEKDVPAGSS